MSSQPSSISHQLFFLEPDRVGLILQFENDDDEYLRLSNVDEVEACALAHLNEPMELWKEIVLMLQTMHAYFETQQAA